MSRIGKLPITVPDNVDVNLTDSEITVKGKFGILQTQIPNVITVTQEEGALKVSLKEEKNKAMHGLYRTLINNMVVGVSEQFDLTLILKGVGYRAAVQGKQLVLNLGYSHPVNVDIPAEITVEVVQNTTTNIKSCDK